MRGLTLRGLIPLPCFAAIGIAACTSPDRVTNNTAGTLVIKSERDTTVAADTVVVGGKAWLKVVGADAAAIINWSVSDSSVVRILQPFSYRIQLSALRAGTATVTATRGARTGSFGIVVRDSTAPVSGVDRVQITTPKKDSVLVQDSVRFAFNILNSKGELLPNVPFTLARSDTTVVAFASDSGHSMWLRGLAVGKATVKVSAGGKSDSADITVRARPSPPPPPPPPRPPPPPPPIGGYDVIDLGTLGGNFARPYALNDNGQVVGTSITANRESHAFVWDSGAMHDLNIGYAKSSAETITNSGLIGGVAQQLDAAPHVFLWRADLTTDLGSFWGTTAQVNVVALMGNGD